MSEQKIEPCTAWDEREHKCRHGHYAIEAACRTGRTYPNSAPPTCCREDLPFDEHEKVVRPLGWERR